MTNLTNKMKFNVVGGFVIITLVLQLCGCTKEKKVKKAKADKEHKVASDTIFDRESPYYIFIQKNHPEALKDKLFFFKEKDIDLDGSMEAVVAFSKETDAGTLAENVFVLKNDNGVIKQIVLKDIDIYSIDEVKIISLKGKRQSYICFNLFEGPYQEAFAIYELKGNKLEQICISDSFNKDYEDYDDELIKTNNSNEFDGYSQDISYYFFNLKKIYAFENDVFKFKNKYYVVEDYPNPVVSVVLQYMSIKSLDFHDDIINKRLDELSLGNSDLLSNVNWSLAYTSAIDDDEVLKIAEKSEYSTIVTVDFLDSKTDINYYLRFELKKTNEKWQITKIELL